MRTRKDGGEVAAGLVVACHETVILLRTPLPSAGLSTRTERGCQQNNSLADGSVAAWNDPGSAEETARPERRPEPGVGRLLLVLHAQSVCLQDELSSGVQAQSVWGSRREMEPAG